MRKFLISLFCLSCATTPSSEMSVHADSKSTVTVLAPLPEEVHFSQLRQLTSVGETAEAYWSFDGKQLSLQARAPDEGCDRIYRINPLDPSPKLSPVSSGKGATTCSHFLPNGEIIYASTHLAGPECPPKPDMRQGYVWALYDSYDLFRADADGTNVRRLTETPGYDAEGTVCAKDGSIVFTSTRDGDLELYRMDSDGKNVKRLTHTPGYDGGAFFNADCTKLVWRASRPKPGKELEDFQGLLAKGLVRPSKLELFVANADGSEPVQVTYLNAATFAPFFFPDGKRILFSSNARDPKGREFNIWAVNVDGSQLEQITYAAGFDGFPMFSPDGKWLAFSSNRATAQGRSDTNLFVTQWKNVSPAKVVETGAERIGRDIAWLAAPEREGRGVGTKGLVAAGEYLEARLKELGLEPAGKEGFRSPFPVTTGVTVKETTELNVGGATVAKDAVVPAGFSANATVKGELILAGYGIDAKDLKVDDYAKKNVKGKIVVVRRFTPEGGAFADTVAQRRWGDLRHKAWVAREKGAKALLVVDSPVKPKDAPADWSMPNEARLPAPAPEGYGDAGLPVVFVKREAFAPTLALLEQNKKVSGAVTVALEGAQQDAFNVVARLPAPVMNKLAGTIVVGAHYDHLGLGGRGSLAPDKHEAHGGADDNASGTAALLEVARILKAKQSEMRRDVVFIAFSAEEGGVLGSTAFTREPTAGLKLPDVVGMLNMDMVGRMRANRLIVLGSDSAEEWNGLVQAACDAARVECTLGGDGYGPSDQTPFYASGVPVLHFFTGAHSDYHKPTDEAARINAVGTARVADIVAGTTAALALHKGKLAYKKVPSPAPRGDLRSFNASLGTIPDYAGPTSGQKGVLLAGVRAGGGAERAGMKRGDVLVKLGKHEISSVEDLMYALNSAHPGETVSAVVVREGKQVTLETTYQESQRPR
ncbi:MAG: M20/M25/M40 family metallo-hydrolase [Myxococcaceae bacterium]